jgi:alanine dehydrogenase
MQQTLTAPNINPAVLIPSRPTLKLVSEVTASALKTGTVLIDSSVELPSTFNMSMSTVREWKIPPMDAFKFEKQLNSANWHFVYFVPSKQAVAFGLTRADAIARAANRFLKEIQNHGFNSAEIVKVTVGRFLGLYRAKIRGNARQLQDQPFPHNFDHGYRFRRAWDFRRLFHVANQKGAEMKAM